MSVYSRLKKSEKLRVFSGVWIHSTLMCSGEWNIEVADYGVAAIVDHKGGAFFRNGRLVRFQKFIYKKSKDHMYVDWEAMRDESSSIPCIQTGILDYEVIKNVEKAPS